MKNKNLLLLILLFSGLAHPEDNALEAAMPDVTALKVEECSASHTKLLGSVGLGQMACTVSKHINFDSLSKSLGVSAFQSGSRTNPLTPSDDVEDFVRYSPAFFSRVNQLYMKNPDSFIYGVLYKYLLDNSTRLFYLTGKNLRDTRRLQKLTLEQYKTAINDSSKTTWKNATAQCKNTEALFKKQLGAGAARYADTFKQCGKSGTAVFFWYRRQLDGSGEALFTLLDNILRTQDGEFYRYARQ
jgi:hypothetical protein